MTKGYLHNIPLSSTPVCMYLNMTLFLRATTIEHMARPVYQRVHHPRMNATATPINTDPSSSMSLIYLAYVPPHHSTTTQHTPDTPPHMRNNRAWCCCYVPDMHLALSLSLLPHDCNHTHALAGRNDHVIWRASLVVLVVDGGDG